MVYYNHILAWLISIPQGTISIRCEVSGCWHSMYSLSTAAEKQSQGHWGAIRHEFRLHLTRHDASVL